VLVDSPSRYHGENQCLERCVEEHVQRGEAGKAPSAHPPLLQGRHQVLVRHAEARYEFLVSLLSGPMHGLKWKMAICETPGLGF
jgi:hypothetical protein